MRGDNEFVSVWQWDRSRKTKGRILDISKVKPRRLADQLDGRHETQRRIKNDKLVGSEQLDKLLLILSAKEQ